ncbi:hypothetical protein D9611_012816 [Ephemerocybe angulata]|uniref:Protein BFR2 n=1 Tax=Ephemerocybe angulata TaxID=980116 RepID=A0A8H5CBC7_9AGAR|nr:hypothetical protein D9611_012816 [Tulosesus angulatus]
MARLSLAQQLAQLEDTAPVDFDPESLNPNGTEEGGREVDLAAAREHYMDVGPSTLRKMADSIADPKYDGVRTSRKTLAEQDELSGEDNEEDEDQREGEGQDDDESSEEEFQGFGIEGPWSGEEDEDEDEDEESEGSEEEEYIQPPPKSKPAADTTSAKRSAPEAEEPSGDLTSTLKTAREADRRKGKAVAKQIALWDGLLDSRIRLQKAVLATNKLPEPSAIKAFQDVPECADALLKLSEEALGLADDLFQLQERLFSSASVTPPPRKRRRTEEEASLATASEGLVESSKSSAAFEQAYHPQLVQNLAKWSSKIQAVAPSVLLPSNKGTFSKGKQNLKSAVQLVDEALLDHSKLLSRTQLPPGTRIGSEAAEDSQGKEETELFDDNDFYQKMLRAIIDSRGDGKGTSEDWLAIQKQKKAKKNVDTKASKGRKIRYDVHEKIQNFMVPVPVTGAWHDEQIDELFSSLLGKGFENVAASGDGMEVEDQPLTTVPSGFRVFG